VAQSGTHIPAMAILQNDPRRSDRLVARITPEDKSLLARAAALEGSSLASFVVSHIRDAAQEVIRRHDSIQLNEAESLAGNSPDRAIFLVTASGSAVVRMVVAESV
jgi:uncharacterized protein (DUF1778 family)